MANRLADGTYGMGTEILDWTYYFTFTLKAAERKYTLFKNIVGDTYQGAQLTYADTNIIQKNIPNQTKATFHGIRTKFLGTKNVNNAEWQAILNFYRNAVLRFDIAGKDNMGIWTLSEFFGPQQFIQIPTNAGDNLPFASVATYAGEKKLNIPIVLQELTTWEMSVEMDGGPIDPILDGHRFKVECCGELDRRN